MRRKLAWLAAIACVAWLVPAWALSLGGIRVHSRLNQPLTASIPVFPAPGEVVDETLKVRLAANQDYARAGLERPDFLSDVNFTVEPDRIVISSSRSVREPVIDLLLEVTWSGGKLLRQYTMLLDPEGVGPAPAPLAPSRSVAAAQAPQETAGQALRNAAPGNSGNFGGTRGRAPAPAVTPPLTYRPAPIPGVESSSPAAPAASKSLPRTYGPVRPSETPWSVATKLKPDDSVTTEQVVIALFQWNPTAFGSSLATFKPGVTLRVPDVDVIRRVDPQIAKSRLEEARAKAAPAEPAAAPTTPAATPAAPPAAAAPAPASAAPKAEAPPKVETPTAPVETAPSSTTTPTAPAPSATTSPETAPAASEPAAEPAMAPPTEAAPPAQEAPAAAAPGRERKKEGMGWLIPAVVIAAVIFLGILIWRLSRRPKSPGADFAMDEGATLAATPRSAAPRAVVIDEPEPEPMLEPMSSPVVTEPESPEAPERYTSPEPTPTAAATPPAPTPAPAAAKPAGMPSFADTALTDTRQIDLEGGDALAEADFHLAYGLYDEAILLLTQALARDPHRSDVRTKLAEAYFSANRGQEFLDTAKTLKGQLDPAGWEKIAVLGRQLFPSDALFGGSGKGPAAPAASAPSAKPAAADDGVIAFDMPPTAPKPAASPPASKLAEAAIAPFEIGSLDLDTPIEDAPAGAGAQGLDLDSGLSADDAGMSGGDEASTKLDLARAYIDLGDNDMARGLLSEVIQQGTSDQKATAEELMRKLPA